MKINNLLYFYSSHTIISSKEPKFVIFKSKLYKQDLYIVFFFQQQNKKN